MLSLKWRMKFNPDKCSVLIFGGSSEIVLNPDCTIKKCTCKHHFVFGKVLICEVLMYKYLGVELDNQLTFVDFKNRLILRSRINMSRIWKMGMNTGYLSVKASLNLVRSVLEFGSEVWGDEV